MKSDLTPAIFFGTALALVVVGAIVSSAMPDMCGFPAATDEIAKGGWCFEFWLNRYQTLLGGIFTLVAAAIAAAFVFGQTWVARQQLDVMLGNIEPDFILRRSQNAHGFDLIIANQNRRPLLLKKFSLLAPADALMVIDSNAAFRRLTLEDEGKTLLLDGIVGGTRPAAAQVTSVEIFGSLSVRRQDHGSVIGTTVEVKIQIDFEIMGSDRIKTATVSVPDVKIGGSHWSTEDAVGVCLQSR